MRRPPQRSTAPVAPGDDPAVRALPSVLLPGISPLRSAVAGLRATPLPCQRLHDELQWSSPWRFVLPVSLVTLSSAVSDWDFRFCRFPGSESQDYRSCILAMFFISR
ncbi:hypothetical protein EJB05_26531 [Eragrostis curvula]|uniref:Uncharacterized protein n=1 Tax=Eragrostis curvula TaxID=38414 RepID=A0A5J9UK92_9POAL|nr:hypothetical protein EJB05_26531 [Eragrostis curvula]